MDCVKVLELASGKQVCFVVADLSGKLHIHPCREHVDFGRKKLLSENRARRCGSNKAISIVTSKCRFTIGFEWPFSSRSPRPVPDGNAQIC